MTLAIPITDYAIPPQVLACVDQGDFVSTPKGTKYRYTCPRCHVVKYLLASTLTYKRLAVCNQCSHSDGLLDLCCRGCGVVMKKVTPYQLKHSKGVKRCVECIAATKARIAASKRPARVPQGYTMTRGYRIYPRSLMSAADNALMPGNGRVLEHRLIMARHLGRPLEPGVLVRHLNGNKTDNRIENLALGDAQDNKNDHMTDHHNMLYWRNTALALMRLLNAA